MTRTERLYALVQELRSIVPATRSATDLAERFAVDVDTIERDLVELADAGVPIQTGRGGYRLDRPPVVEPTQPTQPAELPPAPEALIEALTPRRVLRLSYADRFGDVTERTVEPLAFVGGEHWYLVAWCRLRDDVRGFRLDRIRNAVATDERPPERDVDLSTSPLGNTVLPLTTVG